MYECEDFFCLFVLVIILHYKMQIGLFVSGKMSHKCSSREAMIRLVSSDSDMVSHTIIECVLNYACPNICQRSVTLGGSLFFIRPK